MTMTAGFEARMARALEKVEARASVYESTLALGEDSFDFGEGFHVDDLVERPDPVEVAPDGSVPGEAPPPADAAPFRTFVSGNRQVDDALEFNIQIDFVGDPSLLTNALARDFARAANFLSRKITEDVPDALLFGEVIDDVRIEASIVNIDGRGGILGQAGPTYLRGGSSLPMEGIMEFDQADATGLDAQGLWLPTVLHEMIHVLGLGTIWDRLNLVDDVGGGDLRFTGPNANAALAQIAPGLFQATGGEGIFIETDGGPGTAGGHWDEARYGRELMTGFIDPRGNFVSGMTIASLEDLGYETVWESPA